MRRVDGQGREHREDPLLEHVDEVHPVVGVEVVPIDQLHALLGKLRHQGVEQQLLLLDHEAFDIRTDCGELLAGRQPTERRAGDTRCHLILERGDADLEELVEVRRADRHELQPLEQGYCGLLCQGQHAPVEVEPAQLSVE